MSLILIPHLHPQKTNRGVVRVGWLACLRPQKISIINTVIECPRRNVIYYCYLLSIIYFVIDSLLYTLIIYPYTSCLHLTIIFAGVPSGIRRTCARKINVIY